MGRDVKRLSWIFDLLIIGGGINGAAIAHLAAKAGLAVCLIEKDDFSEGTSSRSTKLLHGGIRYLEQMEFDLVQEALRERYIQWQAAPYLVKPLPFVVPVYAGDKRPLWMMHVGVWLYDQLSGPFRIGQHRRLSGEEVLGIARGIEQKGLKGAVEYYDAQMDDTRLVIENVLMAKSLGACVINHMKVIGLIKEDGRVRGVKAIDQIDGKGYDIKAKVVLSTTGPWADEIQAMDNVICPHRLRKTKGVHLVYEGQIAPQAFLIQSKQDNRIFFVIPFEGNTLIGTTDTDYTGSPDNVRCEKEDIQYLLTEASRIFPHILFDESRIITTFAGVRPLVLEPKAKDPSKVSRKHVIGSLSSGLWYVMGGKYTTYRLIALETLRRIYPEKMVEFSDDGSYQLYGSGAVNTELKILRHRYGLTVETIRYLISLYGSRYEDVLKMTLENPAWKQPLLEGSLPIVAQVHYSREVELAASAIDVWSRRLKLIYSPLSKQYLEAIEKIWNA